MVALRSFDEIARDGTNAFVAQNTGVTDFNEGSVVRSLLEAVWLEFARLYLAIAEQTVVAQEQAAFTSFNFAPLPARAAAGTVVLTLAPAYQGPPILIPAGTTVSVPGGLVSFATTADVTLSPAQPIASVIAQAQQPGAVGNVPPNTITAYNGPSPDVVSVTNPRAFITGADPETDLQRRQRFALYVQTLARGTRGSILAALLRTVLADADGYPVERVVKASTIESAPGYIQCWVHNGVGATSQQLVALCQQTIDGYTDPVTGAQVDGYKAAGIRCDVFAATEVPIDVNVSVALRDGYLPQAVVPQVQQAIAQAILVTDIGGVVRPSRLRSVALATPGVLDVPQLQRPAQNIQLTPAQVAMPGQISVQVVPAS